LADCKRRPGKLALLRGCHHRIGLMKKGRAPQAASPFGVQRRNQVAIASSVLIEATVARTKSPQSRAKPPESRTS
jgi:hypothetical protein